MNNRKKLSTSRQVSESTGSRTHGPTDRRRLAGFASRTHKGSGYPLPSSVQRVQRQLGKKVRTLRQRKGLTSEQLAKGCGVTALKISKIEDGQVNVALSTMIHLSKRLGARLDHLFEGIK